jgi:PEP-CTERM motif
MRTMRRSVYSLGLAAAGLVAAAGIAQAQLVSADVGVNPTFEQTGSTLADVTSTGGFFSGRAFVTSPTDFSGGTLTYGGPGSPQPLSFVPADGALEFSASNSSFSTLQSLFPVGDYTFALSAGTQPAASVGIDYEGGAYSNVPLITNFSALQGLNASESFTVDLNTYVPGSVATGSSIFFSVTNSSGTTVFSTEGLSDTTTSITIPGGTLAAGGSFTFDLLFDNRIGGTAEVNGLPVTLTQFYDTHTDGTFATAGAVPEPSTWAMLLMGFAGIGFLGYRQTLKACAAA